MARALRIGTIDRRRRCSRRVEDMARNRSARRVARSLVLLSVVGALLLGPPAHATDATSGSTDPVDALLLASGGAVAGALTASSPIDADADGFDATTDCNDAESAIHPGA